MNFTVVRKVMQKFAEEIEISPNLFVQRLDGRQTYDYRRIKVSFGAEYGCCFVELGETR